ncbi:MAG: hypothetical protein HY058_14515 [Proteobacteria bacterium]|nr:hypothetical protein [Pseudomonadota bacterium]
MTRATEVRRCVKLTPDQRLALRLVRLRLPDCRPEFLAGLFGISLQSVNAGLEGVTILSGARDLLVAWCADSNRRAYAESSAVEALGRAERLVCERVVVAGASGPQTLTALFGQEINHAYCF